VIKVALADDHEMIRDALALVFSQSPGIELVGQASDGREAVHLALEKRPDIVVLDVFMPILNGVDAFRQISSRLSGTGGVLISGYDWCDSMVEGLRVGVRGFVPKTSPVSELLQAIRVVAKGGLYVSSLCAPGLTRDEIVNGLKGAQRWERGRLSPREREILQLIAEGRTSKEIAKILNVSVKTAQHYRERLIERAGIHNVAGLTRFAIRKGLITP
jgi:DNA-binding NarL/FixJ family response regulator